MAGTSGIELIDRARTYGKRIALVDVGGSYTYDDLLERSANLAACLLEGGEDLGEARVAFLAPCDFTYVWVQWGIWMAGGIAVPLSELHPLPELEFFMSDSGAEVLIVHPSLKEKLRPLAVKRNLRLVLTTDAGSTTSRTGGGLPVLTVDRRAMLLYTSGSTGRPKGVVFTHGMIEAQVQSLIEAWDWRKSDRILNVLPLNHIHGIINVLTCALSSEAVCELFSPFRAMAVWERFLRGGLTLFMAVPTIYYSLIDAYEAAAPEDQEAMRSACRQFRLMVSGSAPLPLSILEKWEEISGHVLLERYGMTETGMILTNPLQGERHPGCVGQPLPGMEVCLVDDSGRTVRPGRSGEIQVRGPSVFREYWNNTEATADVFCGDWFKTGDIAVCEEGRHRILGRRDVDIIKVGGYKVSALEIENVLREHPAVKEAAVVGLEDRKWGQRVGAAVVAMPGQEVTLRILRSWSKERMAAYKAPARIILIDALPRNTLGKVTKRELVELFKKR